MTRVLSVTAAGMICFAGACARSTPTAPEASALSSSGLPVTAAGLPVLEFSIDLKGPARGSVVTKGTPVSVSTKFTARGPASWTFLTALVRDDGATYVLQNCLHGGSMSGPGITTSPSGGGSSDVMDGAIYLFSRGHTVNAVGLAKYSNSPTDYPVWVSNGLVPTNKFIPIPGAVPHCVFTGDWTPGTPDTNPAMRTIRMAEATERQDIPLNWRVETD
jgi:hypothetical protein